MRLKRILVQTILLTVVFCVSSVVTARQNWNWPLPAEKVKTMNMFERAQYDKASKLLEKNEFKAAASEFEKFKIQFTESPVMPYIIFLHGYALHCAKDRYKAIKTYNEVMDFFPQEIYAAGPALYYMGTAHFDNGDYTEGIKCMKEMADDEDYQKHPLAASALSRLADNYWKNKQPEKAMKYLKQIIADFREKNQQEVNNAINELTGYYIRNGKFKEYENWFEEMSEEGVKPGQKKKKKQKQTVAADGKISPEQQIELNMMNHAFNAAYLGFSPHRHQCWPEYTEFNKKKKTADMKAFMEFFMSKKAVYQDTGIIWSYYEKCLQFLAHRYSSKNEMETAIADAVKYISELKDPKDREVKYGFMVRTLIDGGKFDMARHINGKLTDSLQAGWNEYYILERQGLWPKALKQLETIEDMNKQDAKTVTACLWKKGWIYKDLIGKFDEAIKVYRDLNEPPRTLWYISECYFRKGDLKNTIITLAEIENSFPNEASNAAWHKAYYYKRAGNNKLAVSEARRIMKMYPKTPASSNAHQMLEEYGIDTGGAVTN